MRLNVKVQPGQKFGRLTTLTRVEDRNKQAMWSCLCVCGATKIVGAPALTKGATTSCGCYRKETTSKTGKASKTHDQSKSQAYKVWASMRYRCNNPDSKSFPGWGGRGIKIDPAWDDFAKFYSDMGDPPPGGTIERIDNSRGYSAENCRWATHSEQQNNKRSNLLLTSGSQTLNASQWANEKGLNPYIVWLRIRRGWPVERALNTPVRIYTPRGKR